MTLVAKGLCRRLHCG